MQGLRLTAITDVQKPNFDVNVDGRTNGITNIRTNRNLDSYIAPGISHPAISRCDNKSAGRNSIFSVFVYYYQNI